MSRFYNLTEFGKLKAREIISQFIILLGCMTILGGLENRIQFIIYLILLSMNLYLLFLQIQGKERDIPIKYTYSIFLTLLILLITFILLFVKNQILHSYGVIINLFAYIYIFGIYVYFLLNLIYIYLLKKVFPQEGEMKKNQFDKISLKKLSSYIDLEKQKLYFSLGLINTTIYLLFVFYVMLFLIKVINANQMGIIESFSYWVKDQEWLSMFNGISVLSLLIAIYTITFAAQNNILKEAKEKYRNKYLDYV